jgi:GAF domain-containing protein
LAIARETPHTHSFCQHVQVTGAPLIVEDAREHPLVHNNLAIPDLGVIAYAGLPIWLGEGAMGSFCAIDSQPREWSDEDLLILQSLADQVSAEVEQRLSADGESGARPAVQDLRIPLNTLNLSIQALSLSEAITAEQVEYFQVAHAMIGALSQKIGDLEDLAEAAPPKHEEPSLFSDRYCGATFCAAPSTRSIRWRSAAPSSWNWTRPRLNCRSCAATAKKYCAS